MTALKYWDAATGTWKVISSVPGPTGPPGATGATGPAPTPVAPDHSRYTLAASLTAGTWAVMTPTKHSGSGDAAAFSISSSDIVVRDAGTYHITAFTNSPGTATRHLNQIQLNGANLQQVDSSTITGASGVGIAIAQSITAVLAAGDRIAVWAWSNVAGAGSGNLSLVRVVQGAKGDPGPAGGAANQVAQSYAVTTGYTKDRAFNPLATTVGEVAAILATLIDDMKAAGLIQP